ncbi:hypothetical protein Q5P01_009610 [Channa striata]|uniref:Secreted protein n=1 Tax=Channa striata TaxID=64152 RepID=A0AA88SUW3_CHASR|nr:hypothetical protein Q5P01_009610 [Channa striata]
MQRIMRSLFSLRLILSDSVFGASPPSLSAGLPSLTQLSQNNLQRTSFAGIRRPAPLAPRLRESVRRAFPPVPARPGSGSWFRSVARIARPLRIVSSQLSSTSCAAASYRSSLRCAPDDGELLPLQPTHR